MEQRLIAFRDEVLELFERSQNEALRTRVELLRLHKEVVAASAAAAEVKSAQRQGRYAESHPSNQPGYWDEVYLATQPDSLFREEVGPAYNVHRSRPAAAVAAVALPAPAPAPARLPASDGGDEDELADADAEAEAAISNVGDLY